MRTITAFLFALLTLAPAWSVCAAIGTPVHLASLGPTASSSPQSATTGATCSAGSALFVTVSSEADLHAVSNLITDQVGNTYNLISYDYAAGSSSFIALYLALNITALPSGDTITESPGTFVYNTFVANCVTGLVTSSALDVNVGWQTSTFGTSASGASGTLGQATEIVLFLASPDGTTGTPSCGGGFSSFTMLQTAGNGSDILQCYDIVSSTASVSPSVSWTTNSTSLYNTMSFKGAGAAPSATYGVRSLMGVGQ